MHNSFNMDNKLLTIIKITLTNPWLRERVLTFYSFLIFQVNNYRYPFILPSRAYIYKLKWAPSVISFFTANRFKHLRALYTKLGRPPWSGCSARRWSECREILFRLGWAGLVGETAQLAVYSPDCYRRKPKIFSMFNTLKNLFWNFVILPKCSWKLWLGVGAVLCN